MFRYPQEELFEHAVAVLEQPLFWNEVSGWNADTAKPRTLTTIIAAGAAAGVCA
jgi:hypothetical protein